MRSAFSRILQLGVALSWITAAVPATLRIARRSLGSLVQDTKTFELAALLRFSERVNWKIMENGKRPARGERKLLQSARRPGTLQERISAFPALSNRETHTSRFPASLPFSGHTRVYQELAELGSCITPDLSCGRFPSVSIIFCDRLGWLLL